MKVYLKLACLAILLGSILTLTLPIDLAHSGVGCKVAIDVTTLTSYIPSFTAAINALNAEGYTVDVWWDGEITAVRLDGYCALIIVCPQAAYSSSEVSAILDFVDSGHGLLFLGEYGKNWELKTSGVYPAGADPIIGPLGVSINNDELYDPSNYEVDTFLAKIHTFPVAHPVTDGISIFMPAATATLEVSSPGTTIATGDDDSYAVDPVGTDPEFDSPPVVPGTGGSDEPVLAASEYGFGRAVVAGDHNWITDQYSGYYDNIPLLVNVVNWLCELCIGPPPVIPEVPLGTIVASGSMIIALLAYIAVPRWRRKQQ